MDACQQNQSGQLAYLRQTAIADRLPSSDRWLDSPYCSGPPRLFCSNDRTSRWHHIHGALASSRLARFAPCRDPRTPDSPAPWYRRLLRLLSSQYRLHLAEITRWRLRPYDDPLSCRTDQQVRATHFPVVGCGNCRCAIAALSYWRLFRRARNADRVHANDHAPRGASAVDIGGPRRCHPGKLGNLAESLSARRLCACPVCAHRRFRHATPRRFPRHGRDRRLQPAYPRHVPADENRRASDARWLACWRLRSQVPPKWARHTSLPRILPSRVCHCDSIARSRHVYDLPLSWGGTHRNGN